MIWRGVVLLTGLVVAGCARGEESAERDSSYHDSGSHHGGAVIHASPAPVVVVTHTTTTTAPGLLPPLPPLPLPSLPPLPPLPQPYTTITATKTVFVETTKRVTRHPVCMTVYGVKPPCLPHQQEDYDLSHMLAERELSILPTPAAGIHRDQETRILGGVTGEYEAEEREGKGLESHPPLESEREAKYLVRHRGTGGEAEASGGNKAEATGRIVEGFFGTVTHLATKTLWVTKLHKYTDYRVTATLVAKNCVPTAVPGIPFCPTEHHWKQQ